MQVFQACQILFGSDVSAGIPLPYPAGQRESGYHRKAKETHHDLLAGSNPPFQGSTPLFIETGKPMTTFPMLP
ncbi:MAG: hypothetical protein A2010_07755 [Nitrospirae bacterium GWD2_57_9]|nr:MAG: hypothetical protein A2010_07755 [Nitrospirae bacterium GWD2_57_9]